MKGVLDLSFYDLSFYVIVLIFRDDLCQKCMYLRVVLYFFLLDFFMLIIRVNMKLFIFYIIIYEYKFLGSMVLCVI